MVTIKVIDMWNKSLSKSLNMIMIYTISNHNPHLFRFQISLKTLIFGIHGFGQEKILKIFNNGNSCEFFDPFERYSLILNL